MHLQSAESSGPQPPLVNDADNVASKRPSYISSTLPFGQKVPYLSVSGPTYLTAQTIVQHAAYTLSDKVFTYSPDTFDLDLALKQWHFDDEKNAHAFTTGINPMQTRTGAGSIALGYMFSPDFDLGKRHVPQTIVASSGSLKQLRSSLDQLALLYSVASPVVLQIAAVDYSALHTPGLVTDYVASQDLAEDLGLAMISSTSVYESQHMSLLATLLAKDAPAMHVYDGVNVGRETTRVVDVLGKDGLAKAYQNISHHMERAQHKHLDTTGKTLELLQVFNDELGTDYKPFEYYGHAEPDTVLVVFGSVEGSLAAQLAHALSRNGAKVGAINVRVYRPFIEEAFVEALPKSVRSIVVLGQVASSLAVKDEAEHSRLYSDILAAVTFSYGFDRVPTVVDKKYARDEVWTPSKMASRLQQTCADDILGPTVKQYTFWDVDESSSTSAPNAIAQLLSQDVSRNVAYRSQHNNLAQGGSVRSDIRCSPKSIEAPYSVKAADLTYVGSEHLLLDFDVLTSTQQRGTMILKLPDSKDQDQEKLEKRMPVEFRKGLSKKQIQLYLLDPKASSKVMEDVTLEDLLLQLSILQLTQGADSNISNNLEAGQDAISALSADLQHALRRTEIPESWATTENSQEPTPLATDLRIDSFAPFKHEEMLAQPATMSTWKTAARALAFKEATGAQLSTRPDLGIKTHTVRVKSRKRLTPTSYDRNIFHIEFDLTGTSLTYNIGEALGIHAENNAADVLEFIKWYNLSADSIVSVPSRADPTGNIHENRTVYQSLMQNIDIFGRPPKRFYAELADYADDEAQRKELMSLAGPEGANEFKRRAETDTITYADILLEFPSAHPSFADIVRLVGPLKRREYSIASSQRVQPDSVALLIVTVGWVDPRGRDRFGQATRYMNHLSVGDPVTVSVKPSVMKLPKSTTAPLIMAGLGTGLAPFRAFVQERAWQRSQGHAIGEVLLYMGARHQREEYLYGEEWEAYRDAGVITLMGCAFSRDQAQKIYIQDRMRESLGEIQGAYLKREGSFYLCGPTWPVPDVQGVLEMAVEEEAKATLEEKAARKVKGRRRIEELKDEGRYVLEVY